jgi:nitroimidazol reductase NimA-like FMN-containing flavoprotein (pyridoxamine 5'-phosphate oxidase superfamily)
MTVPEAVLDSMPHAECVARLRSRSVGRLGLLAEHYPLILPVNYSLDRDVVVVRTRPGTPIALADHRNVTFQIDDFDPATRTGWSVLVRGQAEVLTGAHSPQIRRRTHDSGVQPWPAGAHDDWMRIIPHGISGRRISVAPGKEDAWSWGIAAYM